MSIVCEIKKLATPYHSLLSRLKNIKLLCSTVPKKSVTFIQKDIIKKEYGMIARKTFIQSSNDEYILSSIPIGKAHVFPDEKVPTLKVKYLGYNI